MQLFCFTVAGGNASFFDPLEEACAARIEFVKLEYPGHGFRRKEKLCDTFQELSIDLYGQIKEHYSGGEYAVLGYSMGSIAVLETLRVLTERNELPYPCHVFLAAHEPKKIVDLEKCNQAELDEYVKNRTILFGGLPEQLVGNKLFWRVYLPLYKADYFMISRYNFDQAAYISDIPATVFYSEEDTPRAEMEHWKRYFVGCCEFVEYTGSHFFINEHCKEMAILIKERLGV